MKYTIHHRFWSKVDKGINNKNCCWNWTGAQNGTGYGLFHNESHKMILAHHFLVLDKIPKDMHVCHTCDNRLCIRPSHLFFGTRSDNMKDCVNKLRHHFTGERNPCGSLSTEEVMQIRLHHLNNISQKKLATQFGVAQTTINRIINRKIWTHI